MARVRKNMYLCISKGIDKKHCKSQSKQMKRYLSLLATALMASTSLFSQSLEGPMRPVHTRNTPKPMSAVAAQSLATAAWGTEPNVPSPLIAANATRYYLKGANYAGITEVYREVQVAFDGTQVWICGFYEVAPDYWIVGDKSGQNLTFACGQYLGQYLGNDIWFTGFNRNSGTLIDAQATISADSQTISFTSYTGATASNATFMNIDCYSVADLTTACPDTWPEPKSTQLVEVPADVLALATPWTISGTDARYITYTAPAMVAISGSDIYVQGWFATTPEAWVHGTIGDDGRTVTFAAWQYLGNYPDDPRFPLWTSSYSFGNSTFGDILATFDPQTHQIVTQNRSLSVASDHRYVYADQYLEGLTLSEGELKTPELTPGYVSDLTDLYGWTIVDANHDGSTWEPSSDGAIYWFDELNKADDYLISPRAYLEPGRSYSLQVTAESADEEYLETMEVRIGKAPTAEAMQTVAVSEVELDAPVPFDFGNDRIQVDEAGYYYFGLHATSDADAYYILASRLEFNYGIEDKSPLAPANLSVEADPTGKLKATLRFTAPTMADDGTALTSPLTLEVRREGVIQTFEGIQPGAQAAFIDSLIQSPGVKEWTVALYNGQSRGHEARLSLYVGVDCPQAPATIAIYDNNDKLDFHWTATSNYGVTGGYVDPESVTYSIWSVYIYGASYYTLDEELVSGIKGTDYTMEIPTNEGQQGVTYYAVTATNEAGTSSGRFGSAYTGCPYDLPFRETVKNGSTRYNWTVRSNSDYVHAYIGEEGVGDDTSFELYSEQPAQQATLLGGKIAMGVESPWLTVDLRASGHPSIEVFVQRPGEAAQSAAMWFPGDTFSNYKLDLTPYRNDAWVRISYSISFDSESSVLFDNITVLDLPSDNLLAKVIAPSTLAKGRTSTLTLEAQNMGRNLIAASQARVSLEANGQTLLDEAIDSTLPYYESRLYDVQFTPSVFSSASSVTVTGRVTYSGDQKAEDDEFTVILPLNEPAVPAPVNVAANDLGDGQCSVSWEGPATPSMVMTEDFENVPNGSLTLDGWTFIEGDPTTFCCSVMGDYSYPHQEENVGWIIIDPEEAFYEGATDRNPTLVPHSGKQYAASFYKRDASSNLASNDDWMISPLLPGTSETVDFWLASVMENYFATVEVLYSTSDDIDINQFESVGTAETYLTDFEHFTFTLPAGARRLALREVTEAPEFLMCKLDDVTFVADAPLQGFRIYVDGQPVADADALTLSQIVTLAAGQHDICVTALYDGAESAPASITIVGISEIPADPNRAPAYLYTPGGLRVKASEARPGLYITAEGERTIVK